MLLALIPHPKQAQSLLSSMDMHLIHLSNRFVDYAQCHKLCPFWKWLNLTHLNTFIHGPFKFTSVNGRKTGDPVSQTNWDILKSHLTMFHNPLLRFNVPLYSILVDRSANVSFQDAAISCQLVLSTSHAGTTPSTLTSPWQKVMASQAYCPPLFIHTITKVPLWRYGMLRWTNWMSTL